MNKKIGNHIRGRGYADHVAKGGIKRLITNWEAVASGVASENAAYVGYDEFLNEMDGRRILQECMDPDSCGAGAV